MFGLRVLTDTGSADQRACRPRFATCCGRPICFCRWSALLVTYAESQVSATGDLVAGTMVVVEERQWLTGVAKLEDPRAIQLAAYLPPNFVVTRSLARSLATYVERRRFFTPPRAAKWPGIWRSRCSIVLACRRYELRPAAVRLVLPHVHRRPQPGRAHAGRGAGRICGQQSVCDIHRLGQAFVPASADRQTAMSAPLP